MTGRPLVCGHVSSGRWQRQRVVTMLPRGAVIEEWCAHCFAWKRIAVTLYDQDADT